MVDTEALRPTTLTCKPIVSPPEVLAGERETIWELTIYTVAGSSVTFWTGPALVRMADQLRELASGLAVAREVPQEFRPPGG